MASFFLAVTLGYLLGSIPVAYLVVRWRSDLDIRNQGSGNVGTLNSYEVTNSKTVGIVVLLLDLIKGLVAVYLAKQFISDDFRILATAGVASVIGHNFPVWLGFRGGRGLATAAGVMLMLGWIMVPFWMFVWFIGNKIFKDVNVGNALATISMILVVILNPFYLLTSVIPNNATAIDFKIYTAVLALVILVRLIQPVRQYLSARMSS